MKDGVSLAVIGAGVVGSAVAALAARAGHAVALLEESGQEGTGITSRNSGVIHSGLYYEPHSLKARSCVRGQALLYEWCREHHVPHRKTGKLVVAHDEMDMEALSTLASNAHENGARDVTLMGAAEAVRLEPALPNVLGALYCPHSGIVDPHALTRSLCVETGSRGGLVLFHSEVREVKRVAGGFRLETTRGPLDAESVVNAAGLKGGAVAKRMGVEAPTLFFCRGDYFRLHTKLNFTNLIYPVRRHDGSGLGVHLCLELDGGQRLGPDTQWVESGEDVGPPTDVEDKRRRFHALGQKLLGSFPLDALSWDGCGVRPKLAHGATKDFLLFESPKHVVHLMGIESPGLTSALALAESVLNMLGIQQHHR